jgi:hypothetical protein
LAESQRRNANLYLSLAFRRIRNRSSRASLVRWIDVAQATGQINGSAFTGSIAGFSQVDGTAPMKYIAAASNPISQPCLRATVNSKGLISAGGSNADLEAMQSSGSGFTVQFLVALNYPLA